jgi:penicillin-binding protein
MTQEGKEQTATKPKKRRTFGRIVLSTFKWMFVALIVCGFLGAGTTVGYLASLVQDEPIRSRAEIEAKIRENSITGFVYFRDGSLVGQLRTDEDRLLVEYNEIPQLIIDAVVAIEDNDFFEHPGVNFKSLMRAVKQKVLNEPTQTGGSTLTQQLARRVFLSLEKTNSRKLKEILLALRLERYMSKKEILTAYLNKVPFGNGSTGYNLYGIKAAAKGIFDIDDLSKLNVAQAAYLVGLPQSPSRYSAFTSSGDFDEEKFNLAMDRQRLVLKRMLEENKITETEYNEALAFDLKGSLAEKKPKAYNTYPYLMMEVERQASELLVMQENPELDIEDVRAEENADLVREAKEKLLSGGYKIYLTIDRNIYEMMREIASNPENFSPDSETKGVEQVAAILLENSSGAILGMMEGRGFEIEQMNYATQMRRQPGSTMKPIAAYLPALEYGFIQPGSIIDDAPIILKDGSKGFHIPKNYNNRYSGLVTARKALNESLNIPALKLFNEDVTIEKAWEFAKQLGITSITPEDYASYTGVIGGLRYGVSVEELTNAFSSIPNRGKFADAFLIERITDSEDRDIYVHEVNPKTVFSEETAYLMTDMLRTVISDPRGTGRSLQTQFKAYGKIPIAGKTGSTQNYGDVWFVGFTPDITLGVWVGYEQQVHTLEGSDARNRAKSIWALVMNRLVDEQPSLFKTEKFEKPENIVSMTVSSVSGKLPTELTKQAGLLVTDIFNKKYVPKEPDDALVLTQYVTYNGVNYLPKDSVPKDMVREKVMIKRKKPIAELLKEIQNAQASMPKNSIRPLSYYIPADAESDAPNEVDPRTEDGKKPAPPQSVRAEKVGGALRIEFEPSPSQDVVGYRLYRSLDGSPFTQTGSPVLVGDELKFATYVSENRAYVFSIAAVDLAGNESDPAVISYGTITAEPQDTDPPPTPLESDDASNSEVVEQEQGEAEAPAESQNGNPEHAGSTAPAEE